MTDEYIVRLAEPFMAHRDTNEPTIRGREALIAFADCVMAAFSAEIREALRPHIGAIPSVGGTTQNNG